MTHTRDPHPGEKPDGHRTLSTLGKQQRDNGLSGLLNAPQMAQMLRQAKRRMTASNA
jgi:hypothetical protein